MAASSRKQGRDRPPDVRGFLNDIGPSGSSKMEAKTRTNGVPQTSAEIAGDRYNFAKYSSYLNDEPMPDASSEKEQGNEYFKQKKFAEAVECYSRSIALSPTSVAFANRAMAYLKLRRFEEAENDCTEALNLDDRYVKAYSRRATARKELGKLKEAMEDAEFAVNLEPNTPELRKQYSETKALYMEAKTKKGSGPSVPSNTQKASSIKVSDAPLRSVNYPVEVGEVNMEVSDGSSGRPVNDNRMKENQQLKPDLKASVQDLASRAASRYMAYSVKSISVPKTAYEFEVSWRALSDDTKEQAQLLKSISPASLPQIFQNALSAAILIDIVKCTATFFQNEKELALSILDNLTNVPRFEMIIMCLSSMHKTELRRIWDEVFSPEGLATDQIEVLARLRPKYLQKEWQDNMFSSS